MTGSDRDTAPDRGTAPGRDSAAGGPGRARNDGRTRTRRRFARRITVTAVASLLVATAGCDAGRDLTEGWVEQTAERNREALLETQREELPLPEGVPVRQYDLEDFDRSADFESPLVEELVIAARGDDPEYLFEDLGRAGVTLFRALAVDDDGRIYVLERGGPEVRVFGPDGGFLRRFGRVGEGPGDLQRVRGIGITPEHLLVFHRRHETSVWTHDGEFVDERRTIGDIDEESLAEIGATSGEGSDGGTGEVPTVGRPLSGRADGERERLWSPAGAVALADGTSIATYRVRVGRRPGRVVTRSLQVFSRFRDGEETVRYVAVPNWSRAAATVGPRGDLYVSMFGHLRTENFIVAFAPDGTPRWTMINAWSPDRPPQVDLRVDGRGRVWAFPWVTMVEEEGAEDPDGEGPATAGRESAAGSGASGRDTGRTPEPETVQERSSDPPAAGAGLERRGPPRPRPAWVFSPDGELLAVGTLDRRPLFWNWQVAVGDHVYGIRRDAASLGEWEVVRYRLDAPF